MGGFFLLTISTFLLASLHPTLAVDPLSVTPVQVEEYTFPPSVTITEATSPLFLGGAGVRGLDIDGNFVKFTAIAVYLGSNSIESLSPKWKGKTPEDLNNDDSFFLDIISGPFLKLTQVRLILPLTGQGYAEKVTENCINYWNSTGQFTEAEATAVEKFKEVFKNEELPPGASIFFQQSDGEKLMIGFSKGGDVALQWSTVENKQLTDAVLESIIGKGGVSPAARLSLAERMSTLMQ